MKALKIIWPVWTVIVAIVVAATYGHTLWPIALVSLIVSAIITAWIWARNVPGSREETW